MKAFTAMILVLMTHTVLLAQDVREMKLPWKSGQKVFLNLKFAEDISIEAWDKKEVFLKAVITINDGQLNQAHTMDSTISDSELSIETDFDNKLIPRNHWCDCNGNGVNQYNRNEGGKTMRVCSEIHYTVYLPAGADLKLETISGDVKIVNMKGILEAKTVSGKVDVTVPAGTKADVYLKSVMGRVTSDPDLTILKDGLRPMLARKMEGKLNGGGKDLYLESVMGNVSLISSR
jgi:hypothetical protein